MFGREQFCSVEIGGRNEILIGVDESHRTMDEWMNDRVLCQSHNHGVPV